MLNAFMITNQKWAFTVYFLGILLGFFLMPSLCSLLTDDLATFFPNRSLQAQTPSLLLHYISKPTSIHLCPSPPCLWLHGEHPPALSRGQAFHTGFGLHAATTPMPRNVIAAIFSCIMSQSLPPTGSSPNPDSS